MGNDLAGVKGSVGRMASGFEAGTTASWLRRSGPVRGCVSQPSPSVGGFGGVRDPRRAGCQRPAPSRGCKTPLGFADRGWRMPTQGALSRPWAGLCNAFGVRRPVAFQIRGFITKSQPRSGSTSTPRVFTPGRWFQLSRSIGRMYEKRGQPAFGARSICKAGCPQPYSFGGVVRPSPSDPNDQWPPTRHL